MRLSRLTSWSGTRGSKERRAHEKEKSTTRSSGSPSIRTSSLFQSFSSPTNKVNSIEKKDGPKSKSKQGVVASATTTTNPRIFSKPEGDRPCLLFQDDDDDDDVFNNNNNNNNNDKSNKNSKIDKNSSVNDQQIKKKKIDTLQQLMTPNASSHNRPHIISTPKNLFHRPPQEIMIDHLAEPPSPMKEPNSTINLTTSPRLLDDHPGIFLNFQDPREAHIGDPVGDIAMQRQLLDAQRLVRVILGKPLKGDQHFLEASTILQAIRSYALMKAELMGLRKKQELVDGDPPDILQTLGSPAATTPSTTRTGAFSRRKSGSGLGSTINTSFCGLAEHRHQTADADADADVPITSNSGSATLEKANETIEMLQKQLASANDTILELKEKMKGEEGKSKNTTKSLHSNENKNENEEQLIKNHQHRDLLVVEESKQNTTDLNLVLDEIALVPQHILTKNAVREKLKLYCHTITRHSSEIQSIQIMGMKEKMQQSREEAERRIQEIETRLKLQDENHKRQIQAIHSSRDTMLDKDKDTTTKENNNNIILGVKNR